MIIYVCCSTSSITDVIPTYLLSIFLWCCTLQEHQAIPTNVTVSKDFDMVL